MNRVAPGQFNPGERRHMRRPRWWHRLAYINRILPAAIAETVESLHLPPGAQVLDYGCADMQYRHLFMQQDYAGADLPGNDRASVTIQADSRLPLPSGSLDLVLSSQVLEHVDDPVIYLQEAFRTLRDGGRLLLSTHGMMIYHPDPVDYWRWTGQGLSRIVEQAGFELVSQRGVMGLAASGLQFILDSIHASLPRVLRQIVTLGFQLTIAMADRMQSEVSHSHNAMVFIVVARKPRSAPQA